MVSRRPETTDWCLSGRVGRPETRAPALHTHTTLVAVQATGRMGLGGAGRWLGRRAPREGGQWGGFRPEELGGHNDSCRAGPAAAQEGDAEAGWSWRLWGGRAGGSGDGETSGETVERDSGRRIKALRARAGGEKAVRTFTAR